MFRIQCCSVASNWSINFHTLTTDCCTEKLASLLEIPCTPFPLQVSFLEQQLADKTRSGQSHVEELTQMRTELARERAARAMAAQENQERATGELNRLRTLHSEQCQELEMQASGRVLSLVL